MEGGDEEVVSCGDAGCLKEQLGLRAAFSPVTSTSVMAVASGNAVGRASRA